MAGSPELIYFVIHGLNDLGDSIGQDLANQVRTLSAGGYECRVFAEVYDRSLYADLKIESIERLREAIGANPALIIYHWCDGWHDLDVLLARRRSPPVFVRWHNNTPPWFFAPYSLEATSRTLRGYSGILKLADSSGIRVLANSHFSARQLEVLGIAPGRIRVVYPVSDYLRGPRARRDTSAAAHRKPTLLFVGRVVPHKGHRHVLRSAAVLRAKFGINCRVVFPGRTDRSMLAYASELSSFAGKLGVEMELPGEVENRQLEQTYAGSDIFVCLSEHEGFGLPVIEAMRAQLPVVGYRSSAVAETLDGHPLALDSLDYDQIAARIACLVDPDVSREVVSFQNEFLVPRFSSEVGASQFLSAIGAEKNYESSRVNGTRAVLPPPPRISSALQDALDRLDSPEVRAPQQRDAGDRYVTLKDIRAYEALLAKAGIDSETLGFRDACMNISFRSPRPLVGRLVDKLKRIILYSQDGVVMSLSKSHAEVTERLDRIESTLERLSADDRAGAGVNSANVRGKGLPESDGEINSHERKR